MNIIAKSLLVVLLAVTSASAQQLQKINPPGLSKPAPGTYTHVVRVGKTIYIAGQVGTNADGKVAGPGMKEQLEQVFANLQIALKRAPTSVT